MIVDIANDEILCDEKDAQDYVDVLNGLSYHCQGLGWCSGWRNEVAVNMTVAAYLLGLSAINTLEKFIEEGIIDPYTDDESTVGRVETVLLYDKDFCWTWMIEPDWWKKLGKKHNDEKLKLRFRLS